MKSAFWSQGFSLMRFRYREKAAQNSENLGRISIACLLFFLPFSEITITREIFFFGAVSAFVAMKVLRRNDRFQEWPSTKKTLDILVLASFCWGMIALLGALDPGYSFHALIHKMGKQYILYFLAFFFVSQITSEPGRIKWILFPLALATLVMSVYACYQFYQAPEVFNTRASGFTGECYRFSVFLVLSIPIVTVLSLSCQAWLRWLLIPVLPISLAALFFTFTRAAWIAVSIEAFMLVMIFFKKYRKALLTGIVSASLIFMALAYMSILQRALIIHGPSSEGGRVRAFVLSLEVIEENPIMGIGYGKGTFKKYYPDEKDLVHSHNIFLNTTVEVGFVGLAIFVAMMLIIIKTFSQALGREMDMQRKLLLAGILASVIGFLSLNMFDYMYYGWPGQMFWILVGIGYALIKGVQAPRAMQGEAALADASRLPHGNV